MLAATIARRSTLAVGAQALRAVSTWSNVPAGPPDPILGTVLLTLYFSLAAFADFSHVYCFQVLQKPSKPTRTLEKSTWASVPTEMKMASLTSYPV